MKNSFLFFAALSTLMAAVQGCQGGPNEVTIVIPKEFKSSKTTGFYLKWERPWGIEINRGGRSCSISAGSNYMFVYGSLNTTYASNTFYARPMNYFDNFVKRTSNGTRKVASDENMKWHVSEFSASMETEQVTSLVLDVLVEGSLIQKKYKEGSFNYNKTDGAIICKVKKEFL